MKKYNWNIEDSGQLYKYLKHRLLVSILGFFLTLIIGFYLNKNPEQAVNITISALVALLIFLLYILKDAAKIKELNDRFSKAELVYKDIIDRHINLPKHYSSFMDTVIKDNVYNSGIIMHNINDINYAEILKDSLSRLKDCYCATFTAPYTIQNIFLDNNNNNISIDVNGILSFMKDVNGYIEDKNISEKNLKRFFVFNKDSFINDIEQVIEQEKSTIDNFVKFFRLQKNFDLYFLDKNKFNETHPLYPKYRNFINVDIAILDKALIIRRIKNQELAYFYLEKEMEKERISINDSISFFDSSKFKEYKEDCFFQLNNTKEILKQKTLTIKELVDSIKKDLNINESKYKTTTQFQNCLSLHAVGFKH